MGATKEQPEFSGVSSAPEDEPQRPPEPPVEVTFVLYLSDLNLRRWETTGVHSEGDLPSGEREIL